MLHLHPLLTNRNKVIRNMGTFVHRPVRLKNFLETQTFIFLSIYLISNNRKTCIQQYRNMISKTKYFHDLGIIETPISSAHQFRSKKYRLFPKKSERANISIRYQIHHIVNKLNLVEMSQSFRS